MSLKTKIALMLVGALLTFGVISTSFSTSKSIEALKKAEFNKLQAVVKSKKGEVESYLDGIKKLLISLAAHDGTKDAFIDLDEGFYTIQTELKLNISEIKQKLIQNFDNEYLNKVNYDLPGVDKRKPTEYYLPNIDSAIAAQYIFIVDNPAIVGSKNDLVYNPKYKCSYMEAHKMYHPTFNTFLKNFGLYDIFLVDLKGNIIYTDFKEKDFATNLYNGPYSNSGIANAFKKAVNLREGEIAYDDFKSYEPSYNLPAGFIATPIFIDGQRKGVLVFQLPIDKINNIVSFNNKQKEAGLGESGELFLVGTDYKMRSVSRFVDKINNKFVQKLGTTIGIYKINTSDVKEALKEKKGVTETINYLGNDVLSSYDYINVYDTKWAIVAEVTKDEALSNAYKIRNI